MGCVCASVARAGSDGCPDFWRCCLFGHTSEEVAGSPEVGQQTTSRTPTGDEFDSPVTAVRWLAATVMWSSGTVVPKERTAERSHGRNRLGGADHSPVKLHGAYTDHRRWKTLSRSSRSFRRVFLNGARAASHGAKCGHPYPAAHRGNLRSWAAHTSKARAELHSGAVGVWRSSRTLRRSRLGTP